MRNTRFQGENVALEYSGPLTASTATLMVIYDANGKVRPLLPTERLIVDTLNTDAAGAEGFPNASILFFADAAKTGVPIAGEYIWRVNNDGGGDLSYEYELPGEGHSLPVGVGVSLYGFTTITGSGPNGLLATGSGRIVEGTTQGVRPNWQCLQTPNGNF